MQSNAMQCSAIECSAVQCARQTVCGNSAAAKENAGGQSGEQPVARLPLAFGPSFGGRIFKLELWSLSSGVWLGKSGRE